MQRIFTFCWLVFSSLSLWAQVPSTGLPGNYPVGERDLTFVDNGLSSPTVQVRLWYPATTAGQNTTPANGSFPVIAFGHGFNLSWLDYQDLCGHLASWGYFVLSPDVQNGFNVDHQEYARELAACLNFMQQEGGNNNSDFHQLVDSMTGVLGHSMGGGASGLVPSVYPGIDAVSGLAAAETNPSAISALGSYSGPFQAISGDADNTAPEASNQTPMYNAATGQKQWVSIVGGAHCKFTDGATICDLVSNPGSVTRAFQVYLAKKYTTAFFNYFLQADQDALPFLCGDSVLAEVNAGTVANQTNIGCSTVAVDPMAAVSVEPYPNPCQGWLRIPTTAAVHCWDAQGRLCEVPQSVDGDLTELDMSQLPAGLYFIRAGTAPAKPILLR